MTYPLTMLGVALTHFVKALFLVWWRTSLSPRTTSTDTSSPSRPVPPRGGRGRLRLVGLEATTNSMASPKIEGRIRVDRLAKDVERALMLYHPTLSWRALEEELGTCDLKKKLGIKPCRERDLKTHKVYQWRALTISAELAAALCVRLNLNLRDYEG